MGRVGAQKTIPCTFFTRIKKAVSRRITSQWPYHFGDKRTWKLQTLAALLVSPHKDKGPLVGKASGTSPVRSSLLVTSSANSRLLRARML